MTFKYMSPEQTLILTTQHCSLPQRNSNPTMFRKKLLLLWCFCCLRIMSPFFHFCDLETYTSSSFPWPPLPYTPNPAPSPVHFIFFPIHLFSSFPAIILGQAISISYLNYFKYHPKCLLFGSLQLIYILQLE